jgi:hypothetical protein
VLHDHLPNLGAQIEADHQMFDLRTAELTVLADELSDPGAGSRHLYLELGRFTSGYLAHQDTEERVVLPALEQAIGPEALLALHVAIVTSIPPTEMAKSLAFMLPAMNIDNRAEMLGGIRATAPTQVFEGTWGLATSVLTPADCAALAERLGLN